MDNSDKDDHETSFDTSHQKYVSQAALHLAWGSAMNIPKEKLDNIKEQGILVTRGRFSKKEDKRILKNWKKFCKHFPMHADPLESFGVFDKPLSNLQQHTTKYKMFYSTKEGFYRPCRKQRVRSLKRVRFLLRLSRKLDDRLTCDIYRRAKRIIAYKSFNICSRKDISEEVESEMIQDLFVEKMALGKCGAKHDVDPTVVEGLHCLPLRRKKYTWTKEDDLMLESAIERQFDNQDPSTIPLYMIDFELVRRDVAQCGKHFMIDQLYRRWKWKNPTMAGLKYKQDQPNIVVSCENIKKLKDRKKEKKKQIVDENNDNEHDKDSNYCDSDVSDNTEIYEDTCYNHVKMGNDHYLVGSPQDE